MADQPWGDYTDGLINQIDDSMGKKYGMTVRAFLTNPGRYANQENIAITISNMREDVNNILDQVAGGLKEQRDQLNGELSKVASITSQLGQNILMQAKQKKIPLIKPVAVDRNEENDVTLYINTVDEGTFQLIDRLISDSKLIVDYTTQYDTYNVGTWLFNGNKDYVLGVYVTPNEAMMFDDARAELDSIFDAAEDLLK